MHKYRVSRNEHLTANTLLLTLTREQNVSTPFSFQPGQYAAISFKRHGRPTAARCFSIVSSPTDQSTLQFSMRTAGRYTKALTSLREGDEVTVRGPFGGFVFDATRDKDVVMLAGGIGITPFMSMVRYATATSLTNNIILLFSCRNQEDVPFAAELKLLEQRNPHFKVVFVIGEGPTDKFAGQAVAIGRITPEFVDKVSSGDYGSKSFFICGPPPFMKGMTNVLHGKGVSGNRIMTEAFGQGSHRQTGKIRSWPFNIYVLSAVSVAVVSFVVMISDLIKTLPSSSMLGSSSTTPLTSPVNTRQTDLDSLVRALPDLAGTSPPTDAVTKALQQPSTASAPPPQTSPPVTTTEQTSPTTPTPVVTPKPTPKCTTTQSGVTTCI